jgi:multicomponent Na+:H+ antiporter subunit B
MVILVSKKIFVVSLLVFVLIVFIVVMGDFQALYNDFGRQYFQANGALETGSRNLVTAIYLDYRLFDSLFEAGILLIAVAGIIWISKHDLSEKNVEFMIDHYKTPDLFITFSRLVYPLMLVFGFYVIINGHVSPGGGFQGGAIVATGILILYYINNDRQTNIKQIVTIEKLVYMTIIVVAFISIVTRGVPFTNVAPINSSEEIQSIFLVTLNILIGIKVALGLWTIFTAFLREGR